MEVAQGVMEVAQGDSQGDREVTHAYVESVLGNKRAGFSEG